MKRRSRDWDASRGGNLDFKRPSKRANLTTNVYKGGRTEAVVRRNPRMQYVSRAPGPLVTADNHYFDAQLAATTIPVVTTSWAGCEVDATSGVGATAINALFAPTQGDDITQRQGRKVFVKTIRISGELLIVGQTLQSGADAPAMIRYLIYLDKQANGTQSQAEDLLASGIATLPLDQFQNLANLGRFKVYKDKRITMQNPAIAPNVSTDGNIVQNGLTRTFKHTIKVGEWVHFNATNGGTVADIVDNAFHMICATNSASLAPTISYKVRVAFTP